MAAPLNVLDKSTVQLGFIGLGLMEAGLPDACTQQAGMFTHGTAVPGRRRAEARWRSDCRIRGGAGCWFRGGSIFFGQ